MSAGRARQGVVFVTGATGFIGRALCRRLIDGGRCIRVAVRAPSEARALREIHEGVQEVVIDDLTAHIDWASTLRGVDTVVHLAARAHAKRTAAGEMELFRAINVVATAQVAQGAAAAGVSTMVYMSSVKVNGESSGANPFRETDPPAPEDPYGQSKREAEELLGQISDATGLGVVVLRPPLVYGCGVKANFLSLLDAVARGYPLPFAAITNSRSLVYVENLVDAIVRCIDASAAVGKTYFVADGPPVSTPDLCRALGVALGRQARLFPFPPTLLELAPSLRKLTRSLAVDDSAIRRELDWSPPFSFEEGIQATAKWYLAEARRTRG